MALLDRAFGAVYDPVMRGAERSGLGARRQALLRDLHGHVVEVGAGTGANLPHLGDGVRRITLLEPSPAMVRRLRRRAGATSLRADIEVIAAPAEAIPVGDATADVVVSTLALCSVDDLERTLAEIRRVLRPGGELVLIEHVAGEGAVGTTQRMIEPVWTRVARGCHLTRDTRAAVARAGFDVSEVVPWQMPGGGPAAPAITGVARAPGHGPGRGRPERRPAT